MQMKDLGDSVSFSNEEMEESMQTAQNYINNIMRRVRRLPVGAGYARMMIFQTMALGGLTVFEALQENKYLAVVKGIKIGIEIVEKIGDSVFDGDSEVQFVGVEPGSMEKINNLKTKLVSGEITAEEALAGLREIAPEFADLTTSTLSSAFNAADLQSNSPPQAQKAEGWGGGSTPKPTLH